MTPVPAVNSSPSTPVVFAIGFHASERLVEEFRGRVVFQNGPDSVQKPAHIPPGTTHILMCNKTFHPHKARVSNLARAIPNCQYQELSGLVSLNDRLAELFRALPAPKVPAEPGSAPALHIVGRAEAAEPAPTARSTSAAADSPTDKIRAVTCRPGSQSEWVRDNMKFPCNYRTESRRLLPLALEKFPAATENGIYQAIFNIVDRAGVKHKDLAEARQTGTVAATDSANAAPNPPPPAEVVVGVPELLQGLQQQVGTFASEFAVSLKVVSDLHSRNLETIANLQSEVATLRAEVSDFKPDALAYRKLRAEMLRSGG